MLNHPWTSIYIQYAMQTKIYGHISGVFRVAMAERMKLMPLKHAFFKLNFPF